MTTKRLLCAMALILFAVIVAAADTLYLKNGRKFEGKVISRSGGEVKFKTSYGTLTFPKSQVDRIVEGRTATDEYKDRLKALKDDDLAGRLELARWCCEAKLRSQMKSLLRGNLKLCPNHPETRLELGEIYEDGDWTKGEAEYRAVEKGEPVKIPGSAFEFCPPKQGWTVKAASASVTATGPDIFGKAPVLTLSHKGETAIPADSFPEEEGWEKATEVSSGPLTGLLSRRPFTADLIDMTEVLAVLGASGVTVEVRLTCLRMEEEVWRTAFDLAIESQKEGLPSADYVNTYYKYQVDLPKPSDKWQWREDEVHDLCISYKRNDAIEWCELNVWGADPGQKRNELDGIIKGRIEKMRSLGDIEKEEEFILSGEKAKLTQGTYLDDGIPVRGIYVRVTHGKRLYFIEFDHHEYGGEKTLSAYKTIIESFRFTE